MLAFPVDMSPTIAGLAKAYYAFGGAVFACVASAYFYDAEKAYILFIALTVPVIIPSLGHLLNILPDKVLTNMDYEEEHNINGSLSYNFYHAGALFSCILLYVILRLSEVSHVILGFSAAVVVLCAVSILLIPMMKKNFYMYIPIAESKNIEESVEEVTSPLGHGDLFDSNNVSHTTHVHDMLSVREAELVTLSTYHEDIPEEESVASEDEPTKDLTVRVNLNFNVKVVVSTSDCILAWFFRDLFMMFMNLPCRVVIADDPDFALLGGIFNTSLWIWRCAGCGEFN